MLIVCHPMRSKLWIQLQHFNENPCWKNTIMFCLWCNQWQPCWKHTIMFCLWCNQWEPCWKNTIREQWVNCLVQGQNDRDSIQQPFGYWPNTITTRYEGSQRGDTIINSLHEGSLEQNVFIDWKIMSLCSSSLLKVLWRSQESLTVTHRATFPWLFLKCCGSCSAHTHRDTHTHTLAERCECFEPSKAQSARQSHSEEVEPFCWVTCRAMSSLWSVGKVITWIGGGVHILSLSGL